MVFLRNPVDSGWFEDFVTLSIDRHPVQGSGDCVPVTRLVDVLTSERVVKFEDGPEFAALYHSRYPRKYPDLDDGSRNGSGSFLTDEPLTLTCC